ncbi:hypothetical protein [Mucilaginibacter ginkgonis]|uniref:Uncharacterized protein n=1 Tax=Mucilaginibacter ginkgonis TaxID=2682091 RepID=A0A6I4I0K1_9SPHI|nr:hypothetical protein [Mucilaginibacter ginkgonis]QQL51090.1 hypothetical protein GO620_006470 [Mucilaginibacter ginkgonis]
MQLTSFINKVVEKSAPMSATDSAKLNTDCQQWYDQQLSAAVDAQKTGNTSFLQKIILHTDKWYCRLAFAVAFPIVTSFISGMLNPGQDPEDMQDVH